MLDQNEPALVAVAHGSRVPAAQVCVRALLDVVRAARPGLHVAEAYVELAEPTLPEVLAAAPEHAVVVPLLLGNGYHVAHDVAGIVAAYRPDLSCAPALGPDRVLAAVLADRLAVAEAAGRTFCSTSPVVLAAAGSSDPRAHADTATMARLLGAQLSRPVLPAVAEGTGPSVVEVVAELRRSGYWHVPVATYLLAPGRFAGQVTACGADAVSAPLGAHPALVRLILRRYDEVVRAPSRAPARSPARPSWPAGRAAPVGRAAAR